MAFDAVTYVVAKNAAKEGVAELLGSQKIITLPTSWVDNQITIEDEWIQSGFIYMVSYTDESYRAYSDSNIRSKTQTEPGKISFVCDSTPSQPIEVLVAKMAVGN